MAQVRSSKITIQDDYWTTYRKLVRETVLPYQWEALNDRVPGAEPSYAINNFNVAAGLKEGEFGGFVFQDTDLYKWLEGVAYALIEAPDASLERWAEEAIDLIALAQRPDGYLNTYFTVKEPEGRWTNLTDCHELYCAGHLIEAGVAYYEATGRRKLLDVCCRFADYIDRTFGVEEGKLRGYDGHQEIELALVKLYRVTENEAYLRLSRYFLDERGRSPNFFAEEWERRGRVSHWPGNHARPNPEYHQAHLPVREQRVATGHAVRAVYMYAAMADVARETEDASLASACRTLWANMTRKQMYVTGAIGSTHHGEAFTFDYDLPNDTAYAETCASIGLVFFASRMLRLEARGEYADAMERALYNTIVGSMALDGKHYFYVNPLEVWPEACERNPGKRHVKPVRQPWFGCSCCPPNVARLLGSLDRYIYTSTEDTVYVHLFIGSEASFEVGGGRVTLRQTASLPRSGDVRFVVSPEAPGRRFALALRVPSWCGRDAALRVNGSAVAYEARDGYAVVERAWQDGDTVEWTLATPVLLLEARPDVRANAGKAALQRGPLVYCFEEADNGAPVSALSIREGAVWTPRYDPDLLGGVVVLEGDGFRDAAEDWDDEPYRPFRRAVRPAALRAVPYAVWGNRGVGEMAVWLRVAASPRA
ncbi:glycoside hydrolase family 127 protein [Paenibacillus antri]|uniref:Glycoside hydrolase family 127 protein n=1 Tax=Paenibacillus antri TaxID=2582848 RepID=A0A5R9GET9_9BACL|nr:beta-L-arabinofuranosidase domain-containing protein [Paenibacillus antri]TLS52886.1 glycoside hydrolase family 127 protein [Paenibacillus antri]